MIGTSHERIVADEVEVEAENDVTRRKTTVDVLVPGVRRFDVLDHLVSDRQHSAGHDVKRRREANDLSQLHRPVRGDGAELERIVGVKPKAGDCGFVESGDLRDMLQQIRRDAVSGAVDDEKIVGIDFRPRRENQRLHRLRPVGVRRYGAGLVQADVAPAGFVGGDQARHADFAQLDVTVVASRSSEGKTDMPKRHWQLKREIGRVAVVHQAIGGTRQPGMAVNQHPVVVRGRVFLVADLDRPRCGKTVGDLPTSGSRHVGHAEAVLPQGNRSVPERRRIEGHRDRRTIVNDKKRTSVLVGTLVVVRSQVAVEELHADAAGLLAGERCSKRRLDFALPHRLHDVDNGEFIGARRQRGGCAAENRRGRNQFRRRLLDY